MSDGSGGGEPRLARPARAAAGAPPAPPAGMMPGRAGLEGPHGQAAQRSGGVPKRNAGREARINVRITPQTKERWERFLLHRHGTTWGPYGTELELAMNRYMDDFAVRTTPPPAGPAPSATDTASRRTNKNTLQTLRMLSEGLRSLPAYPLVRPQILKAVVRDHIQRGDPRTIAKYQRAVIKHSKETLQPDSIFPLWDVEGFCMYVDRLVAESHLPG